jgi:hypothetical protein
MSDSELIESMSCDAGRRPTGEPIHTLGAWDDTRLFVEWSRYPDMHYIFRRCYSRGLKLSSLRTASAFYKQETAIAETGNRHTGLPSIQTRFRISPFPLTTPLGSLLIFVTHQGRHQAHN